MIGVLCLVSRPGRDKLQLSIGFKEALKASWPGKAYKSDFSLPLNSIGLSCKLRPMI